MRFIIIILIFFRFTFVITAQITNHQLDSIINLGDSLELNLNNIEAQLAFQQALDISNQSDNFPKERLALLYSKLGNAASTNGDILVSLENFELAKSIYLEQGDTLQYLHVVNLLSALYSRNHLYEQAELSRDEIFEKVGHKYRFIIASAHLYSSLDHRRLQNYEGEKRSLARALEYGTIPEVNPLIPYYCHVFLTASFYRLNMPDSASYHYQKMNEWKAKIPSNPRLEAYSIYAKAYYLAAIKNYNEAIQYIEEDLSIAYDSKEPEHIIFSERLASAVYEELGSTEKAFRHHRRGLEMRDSIYAVANSNQFLYYQALYDTEQKKRTIDEQQLRILKLANRNRTILFLSGLGILLIAFLLVIRSLQKSKKSKIQQEQFSRELIQAREAEQRSLARELHDSAGQNLSYIRSQLMLAGEESLANIAKSTLHELRAVSKKLHPQLLEKLGLRLAIEQMVKEIEGTSEIMFDTQLESIPEGLTEEQELHIFRIVQEAINNAVKYADPTNIWLEYEPEEMLLTIKDNGIGFSMSEKTKNATSLGIQSMIERAKILRAMLKIKTEENRGTVITLNLSHEK